jgi:hypothetical protein
VPQEEITGPAPQPESRRPFPVLPSPRRYFATLMTMIRIPKTKNPPKSKLVPKAGSLLQPASRNGALPIMDASNIRLDPLPKVISD